MSTGANITLSAHTPILKATINFGGEPDFVLPMIASFYEMSGILNQQFTFQNLESIFLDRIISETSTVFRITNEINVTEEWEYEVSLSGLLSVKHNGLACDPIIFVKSVTNEHKLNTAATIMDALLRLKARHIHHPDLKFIS